jgi:hypothetical protein
MPDNVKQYTNNNLSLINKPPNPDCGSW